MPRPPPPQAHVTTATDGRGISGAPSAWSSYATPFASGPGTGAAVPGFPTPVAYAPPPNTAGWDIGALPSAFSTMQLTPPPSPIWYMDSGASNHLTSDPGNITIPHTVSSSSPSSIVVGNGSLIPITSVGSTSIPTAHGPFSLNHVLVTPQIIKNLISVRRFTIDNNCSVEFDPFGLSVKDLRTKTVIAKCNSSSDLYPLLPSPPRPHALVATSTTLWHNRLGHLGSEGLRPLVHSAAISCTHSTCDSLCHACQLGRHTCLPFTSSTSRASRHFDLIHCDLWTSPVASVSGYKYYLVIIDDCSHYFWTFPLASNPTPFPPSLIFCIRPHPIPHHHQSRAVRQRSRV